jgi:hypothetical protein
MARRSAATSVGAGSEGRSCGATGWVWSCDFGVTMRRYWTVSEGDRPKYCEHGARHRGAEQSLYLRR